MGELLGMNSHNYGVPFHPGFGAYPYSGPWFVTLSERAGIGHSVYAYCEWSDTALVVVVLRRLGASSSIMAGDIKIINIDEVTDRIALDG